MVSEIDDASKYEIVVDRSEAIKRAINVARENDIVLVLGKGSETYEKLKDKTIYFNDMEESRKWIKERLEREKISIANERAMLQPKKTIVPNPV